MSRRKDVHVPKVWEVEEISDDDDKDIEKMQKEVEDILSKITSKKKTSHVNPPAPVQFDIKIEVEEFDEQLNTVSQGHHKNSEQYSPQKPVTTNITEDTTQNNNNTQPKKIPTIKIKNQQSLLIQKSSENPKAQPSQSICQGSISPSRNANTYLKSKNNPSTSLCGELNKVTNPSTQQFVLEIHDLMSTMATLAKYGNIADKYIYIAMKNYENIPTVTEQGHLQMALQTALEVWHKWFLKDTKNRGAPLLYKCKECGWAWWHLNSFIEHIKSIHKSQKWSLRFEFEATNGESYVSLKTSIYDRPLPAVRIVNAPCWRCGMLPGDKYQNFNTTTLMYHCQCGAEFTTCYEYRLHLDMCPNTMPKVKKLVNYKCYLCFLRFDTPEELHQHRLLSHTVRSDLPASWSPTKKCRRCDMLHFDGVSDCPAKKRMVPCRFCTKPFSTETVMKTHQSFSKENHKCRLCDEILERECMEMLHLVKHTNNYVVLLKCMMCNNNNTFFYNNTAYNIHILSMHPCRNLPAMKIPVPVKCLQDSGYKVPTSDNIFPPVPCHTSTRNHTESAQGNKSLLKRMAVPKQYPCKRMRKTTDVNHENTIDASKKTVEDDIEEFINTENEINGMILLNNKDNNEFIKIKLEDFEDDLSEENNSSDAKSKSSSIMNSNENNTNADKNRESCSVIKNKNNQLSDNNIKKAKNCDKIFEIKKENTEDNVLKVGKEFDIADTQNNSEINSSINKPYCNKDSTNDSGDNNEISFTNGNDKLIEIDDDEISEAKYSDKTFKIKKENTEDNILKKEKELSIANTRSSSEIYSNINKSANNINSKNESGDNSGISLTIDNDKVIEIEDDEINEAKNCHAFEIKRENTEDNVLENENEFDNADTQNRSESNLNQHNSTHKSSKKEIGDNSEISLTSNNGKVIESDNSKLDETANCYKPVKESHNLDVSKEVSHSNEMLDFELKIEKTIIHSNVACTDPTHMITNIIVKHKPDNICKTKKNNSLSKPIRTHEPNIKNGVNFNTVERELLNSITEKRPENKEYNVTLTKSECEVNKKEINVITNNYTQDKNTTTQKVSNEKEINNKNITKKKVSDRKKMNRSEKKDLHGKDIPVDTRINQLVPDKEKHDNKLVDNPGPSQTIKVEQTSFINNSNVRIKEEILDDSDDEKLVIAEFTDLIRDKTVTLEVKREPAEIFENDMIDWGKNISDEDIDVEDDRDNSGEYITWTPHLGVVRGGVRTEDSDEDDLPLMDIKKRRKKTKTYSCIRCKFYGPHSDYQEHKKTCAQQKKSRKKFYPEDCDSYGCTMCNKQFESLMRYLRHLTEHGYKWLQCPECPDKFTGMTPLMNHVVHHINKNYVPLRGITSANDLMFKMQCTNCGDEVQSAEFFSHWERHLAAVRPSQDRPLTIDDYAPKSPMLRDLIAILLDRYDASGDEHKPLRWCKMCKRPFTRDNECKRHYIEHLLDDAFARLTDTNGLRCQICGDVRDKCCDFRLHIRTHASMPVYRCELCGKTFSDSSNFSKHRKVHNLGVYTCDVCKKKFNRRISLIEHIKSHERMAPISCEFDSCNKVVYSRAAYNKHIKLAHLRSKYRCQVCKVTLHSVKEMWDHKWQVHKLRKVIADCPLCCMQFRKYADVKTHVRSAHADFSPDLKRLNKLSAEERVGNVAHLVEDILMESEEDIIKIEIDEG